MTDPKENAADSTSFAEALEASMSFKTPEMGELLRGTLISVSGDDAFITYGGPSEAVMAASELTNEIPGDVVEGVVVATSPNIKLSRKLAMGKANAEMLRGAFENRLPVEGKVTGRNKGGFDVNVAGMRAFCPLSQIELGKIENPDAFVGRTMEFRITEFSGDGRKLVVSRAAILKEEAASRAHETRRAITPGATLTGTVRSIMPFGAFVDLGGVDGLLHVSEMSRRRVTDPNEVVKVGQQLTVKVTKVEGDGKRISLSIKDQEPDPWQSMAERYVPGTEFTGKVARVADFGLFVELEPGVDGLVHLSQLPIGMKPNDPSLAPGQMVRGWVREVDPSKKRISLAMREVATRDPWEGINERYPTGKVVEGTVERGSNVGVFVQLEPGLTGLIPISELNLPPGGDPSKAHTQGEKLQVLILNVDRNRKRISLSQQGALKAAERGEYLSYVKETQAAATEGKSAMALAMEKALGRR